MFTLLHLPFNENGFSRGEATIETYLLFRRKGGLVFQAGKRDNLDAIRASVGHISSSQDNQQVWLAQWHLLLLFVVLLNQSFDFQ